MAIEPLSVETSDGLVLEGQLSTPDDPWAAVVLAHPHPQFGGDMHSIVTGTLFSALAEAGVVALRFNFRGVGHSQGALDEGRGERRDVAAAVDTLGRITEGLPLVVSGWSFGGDVSLAVDDPHLTGWAAVAPPLRIVDPSEMVAPTDPRPKLVVLAAHDQFRPAREAGQIVAGWPNTQVTIVEGADHFFVGRTERVSEVVLGWMRSLAQPA